MLMYAILLLLICKINGVSPFSCEPWIDECDTSYDCTFDVDCKPEAENRCCPNKCGGKKCVPAEKAGEKFANVTCPGDDGRVYTYLDKIPNETPYQECRCYEYGGSCARSPDPECCTPTSSYFCSETRSKDGCDQPMKPGDCDGEIQKYYYNKEKNECLPFMYTGCGGNRNNYESIDACEWFCMSD